MLNSQRNYIIYFFLLNLCLFLKFKFNKDQRPQSPRDDKIKTATTVTAPSTQTATTLPSSTTNNLTPSSVSNAAAAASSNVASAAAAPTPNNNNSTNLKVAVKPKNEKEIQIQRVSSSPTPSTNEPVNNAASKLKPSSQPLTSQSLPVTADLNNKNADLTTANKTPANVSNSMQVTNGDAGLKQPQQTTSNSSNGASPVLATTNVQAIAAAVGATVESAASKAKMQQQNAQMNSKILANLNSRIQQKQQQQQQVQIPQFHFPHGKPDDKQFKPADDAEAMKQVSAEFRLQKDGKMLRENFADIMKLIGLPRYWKALLFKACTNNNKLTYVTYSQFEQVWTK